MVVNESVHMTTFESLLNLNVSARTKKNMQALRVRNCITFKESMEGLSDENFCELFRSIPGLVFVELEVEDSLEEAMKQSFALEDFKFVCNERHWIIQITSMTAKNSIIFSKDAEFSCIYISGGRITDRGQPCNENHFGELLRNILPNVLNGLKLSLLDLSLTLAQQTFLFGKSDLCRSFLNILANSEIESHNDPKENGAKPTEEQIKECIELVDNRSYNGLMLAIELQDESLIDILIELDFDLGHSGEDGKRAVDLAIDNEMFDVFVKLIEADSPFPVDCSKLDKVQEQPNAYKKFIDVTKERADFLNSVRTGNMANVKAKISKSFRLRFAYNDDNKTALTQAIERKQFEVFAFLQSKGFSKGIDPFYDKTLEDLTALENNTIALCNLNHFQCFTSEHVNLLIRKTKVASRVPDRSKSYEEIWKFYNDLDSISVISLVLQVVALLKNLTISFDFQSLNVHKMHPSQPTNSSGTFYEGGYIYIAAGQWQSDRNEVLGLIAHEFTHCAMKKVYNNKCLPYQNDEKSEEEFKEIVDNTESILDSEHDAEKIISLVYESYLKPNWPAELIVRVPHLLAKYKDVHERIEKLKLTFAALFNFYETKTRPDLTKHLDIANFAEQVKALNDDAGLLRLIKNEEIGFETDQAHELFEKTLKSKINVVISNSPVHSIAAMIKHIDQHESFHITVDLRFFLNQNQQIQKLLESNHKLYLIINCTDQIDECQKKFREIIQVLEPFENILTVDISEKQKLLNLLDESNRNVSDLNHKWKDLTANYQKKIMQRVIKFQGNLFSLEKLLEGDDSYSVLEFLPLNEFVEKKQLAISESPIKPSKFYFSRQFCVQSKQCKNSKTILSSDDIVARVERDNFAIISGIAGSGKTTVLREMAKKLKQNFPDYWVSIVDLKQYSKVFKSEPSSSTFVELAFKLISTQTRHENFEREMFMHFYGHGKVLLLLDGFDEIYACNKQKVCDFLSKFEAMRRNQLWITTRLHQQSDLEKLFGVSSFELLRFDEEEQTKFLIKFWQKDSKANQSTLKAHARFVVKRLNEFLSVYDDESVGIPLLLEIIASTYKDKLCEDNALEIAKTFNLYSLYDELIDQMIATWRYDKGSQSRHDQKQISKSGLTVLGVHQRLAIKLLFSDEEIQELEVSVEYDKKIWTNEALVRVGLVLCSDDVNAKREFLHRTVAEFLVAQFIVLNLRNENQTQALIVFFKIIDKQEIVASKFLNFALSDYIMINLGDKFLTKNFKEHLKKKIHERGTIMKIMWTRNQEQIFRFFIAIATFVLTDDEVKLMLQRKLRFSDNIVQMVSRYGNKKFIKEVFAVLNEFLSIEEIKELLIDIDGPHHNYLHLAASSESCDSLEALLEIGKTYLSDEQHKTILNTRNGEGQSIFLQVAKNRKHECLASLIEIVQPILTVDETQSMLYERDLKGCNILSLLLDNGKSLEKVLQKLKGFLSPEEITDLIFNIDNDGNHILKNAFDRDDASDVIQTLLDDLNIKLTDKQLMVMQFMKMNRNLENQNILCIQHEN